jgi:hypothetical protein
MKTSHPTIVKTNRGSIQSGGIIPASQVGQYLETGAEAEPSVQDTGKNETKRKKTTGSPPPSFSSYSPDTVALNKQIALGQFLPLATDQDAQSGDAPGMYYSNDPAYGGLVVVKTGDTYDDTTGLGTAQVFIPRNPDVSTPIWNGQLLPTNFFNIPIIGSVTWASNDPSAGYISWTSFSLTYQGSTYTITADNTNKKFIWWNKATSTTALQSSDTPPVDAADQFLVALNSGGTVLPSLFKNVIYADYIKVSTLDAISANLGTVTAGTIDGVTIYAGGAGHPVTIDANGILLVAGALSNNSITWSDGSFIQSDGGSIVASSTADDISLVAGNDVNLTPSGNLNLSGSHIELNADISPYVTFPSLTGSVNDWGQAGTFIVLSSNGAYDITGMVAPLLAGSSRMVVIHNVSASIITLRNQAAGSSAANRFKLNAGADLALASLAFVRLYYDTTANRWRNW